MQQLANNVLGSTQSIRRVSHRRRLGTTLLSGLASVSFLLTSSSLLAEVTTLELSPSIYRSARVAPVDADKNIGVVLSLPSSDAAGLAAFVKHVSTPGDPLFHQYLTTEQFAQRFGGSSTDYTALKNWAAANGLSVSQESVGRLTLTLRGNAAQFERLFKTQLNTYRTTDGQTFYSASVKPSIPEEIASKVSGVIGLTDGKRLAPLAKVFKTLGENPEKHAAQLRTDTAGGTGPGGTYSCKDLRSAYQTPLWGNLEKGMVCAVFEQGYYNPQDVKKYFKKFGVGQNTKQTIIPVDGSPITFEEGIEAEACLDIDLLVGMNPNIAEVKVYIDDYNFDSFQGAIVDAFQAIADDKNPPQIVSVSYGLDEGDFMPNAITAVDTGLQELASLGITVLASSGDNGAFGDGSNTPYNVLSPASDPYITGVGGTTLFTSAFGKLQEYVRETAWNELPFFGATGGGVSTHWSLPDYQNATVGGTDYVTANGGSATYRNVPDVSAVADPLTGVGIYVEDQGGWLQIGGTSASCPIWAGYLSNINAALNWSGFGRLGFFNPTLYAVGTTPATPGRPYIWLLNPSTGSNGYIPFGGPGYTNGVGYSNTTGNGSPWGGAFALELLSNQTQAGTAPGSLTITNPKPQATSCKINWTPSSGATAYAVKFFFGKGPIYYVVHAFLTKGTSYTITGLSPNANYFLYVWGYNSSGSSPAAFASFTTAK